MPRPKFPPTLDSLGPKTKFGRDGELLLSFDCFVAWSWVGDVPTRFSAVRFVEDAELISRDEFMHAVATS